MRELEVLGAAGSLSVSHQVLQDAAALSANKMSAASAAQALVLLAMGVALTPLAVRSARSIFPGRNVFFARWGFSHVALLLFAGASASLAAPTLMQALDWSAPSIVQRLGLQSVLLVPALALVFGVANVVDPDRWRSLGLNSGRWGAAAALGVLAYVIAVPGLLGVHGLWRFALELTPVGYSEQTLATQARELSGPQLALFAILAVVVAPLIEELIFRAFLQPLLVQNLGDRGGVVVAALVFAAAHASLGAFLPVFALGVILGALMLRTQRLIAPWTAHALHNGLTLALLAASSSDPSVQNLP